MLEGILSSQDVNGHKYCDNLCGQVLSEHTNRLELQRFTVDSKKEQSWIDDFWQRNKLDDLQNRTHRHSIRDGNYCLMPVWDDEHQRVVIHREPWWDGFLGVFIGYDTYGNMLYAVKEWDTPDGKRRTIYYEGAIERYIQGANGQWAPYALGADGFTVNGYNATIGEVQPIAYVDDKGYPMHIPFVHFSNPGDEFENIGTSIFSGGIIGAQDRVNDVQWDISAAARMTGYQRTWSKGYKLQKINSKVVEPKTGPGVHYHAQEADADWGVLEAGSISELINTYDMIVESVCRATQTPHNMITGNWPSGTALYEVNRPITGATKTRQKRFGPAWIELIHRCMELDNTYNFAGLDEEATITAVWRDAEDRDPLAIAMADQSLWQAALLAVQAGMPLPLFLKIQGWGDDQLTGLATAVEEQMKQNQLMLQGTDPNGGPQGKGQGNPTPAAGKGQGTNSGTPANTGPNVKFQRNKTLKTAV